MIQLARSAVAGLALLAAGAAAADTLARQRPGEPLAVYVPWRASKALSTGIDAWTNGHRELALKWFKHATEVWPADPIAWHDYGVCLYEFRRYDEALNAFQLEWFHAPDAPSAWYGMGLCRLALHHPEEAENDFIMAVCAAPRVPAFWHALAAAMRTQGKTWQAKVAEGNVAALTAKPRPSAPTPFSVHEALIHLRIPPIPKP